MQVNAYVLLMTDTYPKWGIRRRIDAGTVAGRGSPLPPPGPLTYLRNLLVVLSASSLPPVWHVGQ